MNSMINKLAHIHVLTYETHHWIRHIAFRNYLKYNQIAKNEYQKLKNLLSEMDWEDENEYNSAKNDFIKRVEDEAIKWYESNKYKE